MDDRSYLGPLWVQLLGLDGVLVGLGELTHLEVGSGPCKKNGSGLIESKWKSYQKYDESNCSELCFLKIVAS